MKTALIFALFFGVFAVVYSAVSSGFYRDPDHPGMCAIRPDLIVPPGTHKDPEACARVLCDESGFAEIQTCGVELVAPECILGNPKNPDADYPECCEHEIIC